MFSDSTGQKKTFLTSVHSETCKKNVNLKNWKTPNYLVLHELSRDVPSGIFNISQDGLIALRLLRWAMIRLSNLV